MAYDFEKAQKLTAKGELAAQGRANAALMYKNNRLLDQARKLKEEVAAAEEREKIATAEKQQAPRKVERALKETSRKTKPKPERVEEKKPKKTKQSTD